MTNLLLAGLAASDAESLARDLKEVELAAGQVLHESGSIVNYAYFPEDGLVSILTNGGDRSVEAALVGPEGMVGTALLLGQTTSPHEAVVRVPGTALRIPAASFGRALGSSPDLLPGLLRYVHLRMVQAGQTIFATGRCTVDQRLARWLLMAHDRLRRDEIVLTHECLASTLGVRRPGITVALHILEGERAIRSRRGRITILDRACLQRLAGPAACFASPPPLVAELAAAA